MYDFETRNLSFLKTYIELREDNVENCKFFLQLNDPDLAGVDPFDPELSPEMQEKIKKECRDNMWYFVREVVRIPTPGPSSKMFELNEGTLAILFCMYDNRNIYAELPAQAYKTITIATFNMWVENFIRKISQGYSSYKLDDAMSNYMRVKDLRKLLPKYVKRSIASNATSVKSSPKCLEKAVELGRAIKEPMIWFDQFNYIEFNGMIMDSAMPSLTTAMDMANDRDRPYGIALSSTGGDISKESAIYAKEVISNSAPFNNLLYDLNDAARDKYVRINSNNKFIHIKFDYTQLGKTKEWIEEMKLMYRDNTKAFEREILLKWV